MVAKDSFPLGLFEVQRSVGNAMLGVNDWILKYFSQEQVPEVLKILATYGTEKWHREPNRVKRDAIIISNGKIDDLKSAIAVALIDYRDVLISEQVDRRVIEEIRTHAFPDFK